MKFVSLFAGVGGFDLGMERAGHECVAQVEWDKNAAGVLKRRWPDVPLFCDVSKVRGEDLPECDFITYGFPCQDLSVAGKREGLTGKRSGLFYEATRIFREILDRGSVRADGSERSGLRFAVAENVAGLFSADDGLALARCIRELLESGACEVGWRILNSEHFGVPQRRRRVFIVSDFGGESCDEILAVTESLQGYSAPKQKTRESPSRNVEKGVGADVYNGQLTGETAGTLTSGVGIPNASGPKVMAIQGSMIGREDKNGPQGNGVNEDVCFTLTSTDKHGVVHPIQNATRGKDQNGLGVGCEDDPMYTLDNASQHAVAAFTHSGYSNKPAWITGERTDCIAASGHSDGSHQGIGLVSFHASQDSIHSQERTPALGANSTIGVQKNLTVRRLTPKECERLQGFPDDWTIERAELVLEGNEWKATGKVMKQADGPRYKQMGNALTVPVAEWIGKQLAKAMKA